MNLMLLIPIAFGLVAGFFINYVSDVLPHTRRFSQPMCLHCQTPFSWADYLTLRACKQCGTIRSLRTWLVLIATSASFAYFWLTPPKSLGLPLSLVVLTYFAVIIVIDLEHRLILFPTTVFGAALGLFAGTVLYWKGFGLSIATAAGSSLLGGVIGFAVMFLLYQFGALVARYRARKMQAEGQADDEEEALGGGDVYLGGVLGLMVGWKFILFALMYGILIGGAVSLVLIFALIVQRRYSSQSLMTFIPYGPYLIAGAFYMLFLG
jgi:prepilin signal peptidase PulO-like enzyme (type II secretory pathway)